MKTNSKHNQIFKATMIAMLIIALFSTTANAQRRADNTENDRDKRVEQKTNQKATRYSEKNSSHQIAVNPRSKSDSKNSSHIDRNKQNDNNKNNRQYGSNKNHERNNNGNKSDWYDNYYSRKEQHAKYSNNKKYSNNYGIRSNGHAHFDIRLNPIAFRRVPRKGIWVNIEEDNYVMYHRKFYHSSPFGFYRVSLPTYIKYLPDGCQEVWVNGHQLYHLHGIHFLSTPFGFKIIV